MASKSAAVTLRKPKSVIYSRAWKDRHTAGLEGTALRGLDESVPTNRREGTEDCLSILRVDFIEVYEDPTVKCQ